MSEHDVHSDLPLYLTGELSPRARDEAFRHLRGCEACRLELGDLAHAVAELRQAGRHAPVDPSEVPPFRLDLAAEIAAAPAARDEVAVPLQRDRLPRWASGRLAAAGVAGVLMLCVGLGVGFAAGHRHGASAPATVALGAVGTLPSTASATAQMVGSGEAQRMRLSVTGLSAAPTGDHYEVWLLDTRTGRTADIGPITVRADGTMTFPLPSSKLSGYDAIDITLQRPVDGGAYSRDSLLRGVLAS